MIHKILKTIGRRGVVFDMTCVPRKSAMGVQAKINLRPELPWGSNLQ